MQNTSDLAAALAIDQGRHFLTQVIEPLGDAFDPALVAEYESLFPRAIAHIAPHLMPRVRKPPVTRWPTRADTVYVLSRITLGADVAVTSVLLDAAKRRYPNARIIFVGPRKNYELFEADARIEHSEAPYARSGSLQARLEASAELSFPTGLVIDPDSRLTQLGLLRVCPDENYIFFNSRAFGGDSLDRLPDLAARWAADPQARPYVAPLPCSDEPADITISLGVGENPAKRIEGSFERDLLHKLAGRNVLVDLGGTPEERARVEQALPPGMRTHSGAFAPFAAQIARSKLFIGYDSAAGHVASACGVPLISIARGFTNPRMAARWRPLGTIVDNADDVLSSL